MKVPTYSKYGLKKIDIEHSDLRDRKVTHLLTHTLPLIVGGILGVVVFFIYFFKSGQSGVLQVFYQVFLFGTIGVICVGLPMAFFVLAERGYFFFISKGNKKYKTILAYKDDRAGYDFWKVRMDESFWGMLDGLSIEREVINLYMHLGYELKTEFETADGEHDHVLGKDGKTIYLDFRTDNKVEDENYIKLLLENKDKAGANELKVLSKYGFSKQIIEFVKGKPVELLTLKDIIKQVKEIGR
jgi:hypothetical protein